MLKTHCNCGNETEATINTSFLRCKFLASARYNLHDDLRLIDPPLINFDGESQSHVLLHGFYYMVLLHGFYYMVRMSLTIK